MKDGVIPNGSPLPVSHRGIMNRKIYKIMLYDGALGSLQLLRGMSNDTTPPPLLGDRINLIAIRGSGD